VAVAKTIIDQRYSQVFCALLKTAQNWIRRLDNSEISSTGVKVYRVRYGDAKILAQLLNEMFTGAGAGSSIDSASSRWLFSSGCAGSMAGCAGAKVWA